MRVHAILTAAGSGSRYNRHTLHKNNVPKQFLKLNGKAVLLYSLITLQKSKLIDEIIVTSDSKYFGLIHALAVKNHISKLSALVEGGKTRFISVRNAFKQIIADKNDLIIIHDAVRPALNNKMINEIINEAIKYGEVIYGIRVSDTIKLVNKNIIKVTLNRDNLRAIQTPQVFRYKTLVNSYNRSLKKNDHTDESSIVESAGYRVRILEGSPKNIKITTPDDFKLLKQILK
jgi:2-C-methyl-D-erythritol 4-phosphate cytidylyltransferase